MCIIFSAQEGVPKEWVAEQLCQALMDGLRGEQIIKVIHIVDIKTDALGAIVQEIMKLDDPCVKPIHDDVVNLQIRMSTGFTTGAGFRDGRNKWSASGQGNYRGRDTSGDASSPGRHEQGASSSGRSYAAVVGGSSVSRGVHTPGIIQQQVSNHGFTATGGVAGNGTSSTHRSGTVTTDQEEPVIFSSDYRKNRSNQSDSSNKSSSTNTTSGATNTTSNATNTTSGATNDKDMCVICMNDPVKPKVLSKCKHIFCTKCIDESFKKCGPKCPSCGQMYGDMTGNQPKNGKMNVSKSSLRLPGYPHHGSITITYSIPDGLQGVSKTKS
jgi:hypothetical protein